MIKNKDKGKVEGGGSSSSGTSAAAAASCGGGASGGGGAGGGDDTSVSLSLVKRRGGGMSLSGPLHAGRYTTTPLTQILTYPVMYVPVMVPCTQVHTP